MLPVLHARHFARSAARAICAATLAALPLLPGTMVAHAQGAPCDITGGFATLRALMGTQDVGACVEPPWQDEKGYTQQRTSVGQFLWRPSDNWTGFTDGHRTWINGPAGLAVRPNYERFPWESDANGGTVPIVTPRPLVNVFFDWYSASVNGVSPHGNHAAFVKPGDEVTVRLNTVASHEAVFVVDLELHEHQYAPAGYETTRRRVWQTADQHHFYGNQAITLERRFVVPSLPRGRYRVHLGLFTPDWQHMMAWNDYVGFIDVG